MTDPRSFPRVSFEPKQILYDQNGRQVMNSDYHTMHAPIDLTGLYCRKFRLIEKLENLRKGYVLPKGVPSEPSEVVGVERKFSKWDYVLEEVKWVSIDMREERKAKMAISALIGKKMKKEVKQRQTHLQEKTIYHKLISSEMASMVCSIFDHYREDRKNRGGVDDIKIEDKIDELMKIEDDKDEPKEKVFDLGEIKDDEILDYDKMKIEEENGEPVTDSKKETSQLDAVVGEAFKPKNLKQSKAPLRKYIDNFTGYELREKASEIVIEEDGNLQTPATFFAKKIDKAGLCRELQRCMNKWNKNKSSSELNDVFTKLAKDVSDTESIIKNPKDNISTVSTLNVKDDSKKRKKGSYNFNSSGINLKEQKELPSLRKNESIVDPNAGNSVNKDQKKGKEKENLDELSIIWYETPFKDSEYEAMFKSSITNSKTFPRKPEEIPLVGFEKSVEKDLTYKEARFDEEFDSFVNKNCLELESYVASINKKFSNDPKKLRDEATKMRVRSLPIECSVSILDVFNFLPHLDEKPFFVYMDKIIKFIKASEDTPEFKKQLDNITWPLYSDYFFERLHEAHGNKYSIISDALNSNLLTKGNYKYQEKICEFKWLYMHSNKRKKFFNSGKRRLPSHVPIAKETKFSETFKEKKAILSQGSSHKRFALKSHGEKYKDFYNVKHDVKTQENYESSFLLFRNIKNHIRQDPTKGIYSQEGGQINKMAESTEPVVLSRIVWPETVNQTLKGKIQMGTPLTGRSINKEKVSYPYMEKVIEEIITVTQTQNPNANRTMPPQQQAPPQMQPQGQPTQMPPQLLPTQSTPTQLPVASSPHLIPNQMTPTGYNPSMARYPNPNTPGPTVEHSAHMKPNAMVTEPMRPTNMMPNQHPDMFTSSNPQPMMGHRPGPNPMQRGYPNMPGQPYVPQQQGPGNPKMMPNQGPVENRGYNAPYYPGGMGNMPGNMPNMGNNPSGNMPGNMQPNMSNPQGNMPSGNMNTMPSHMPNYPGNMPSNMPNQNMQQNVGGMSGPMPGNMSGSMQGNMPGNMSGNMQGNMPSNMQGGMQGSMHSGGMQGSMHSGGMQGNMPSNMQGGMPGNMPGHMPSNMQGNMPGNMSGPMQGNMPSNMQGGMQGGMHSGNMQGNMPNNMPMQSYHSQHPSQRMPPNMNYPPNYKMMHPSGPSQGMVSMQSPNLGNAPNQRPMQSMGPSPGHMQSMGPIPSPGQMPNMGNMTPTGNMPNMGSGPVPNPNMGNMQQQQQQRGTKKK